MGGGIGGGGVIATETSVVSFIDFHTTKTNLERGNCYKKMSYYFPIVCVLQ